MDDGYQISGTVREATASEQILEYKKVLSRTVEIVGARIQTADPFFHRAFRRQQDHRSVRPAPRKSGDRIFAGQPRKTHIQQNQVET